MIPEEELKRLQNEIMCLREDNDTFAVKIERLQTELKTTDRLLNERQKLLEAIPQCSDHGSCVPHALEWISKVKQLQSENHGKQLALEDLAKTNYEIGWKFEDQKEYIKKLQSDLNGKNFLLDKALIDTAILVQEITYLKEQNTLLKGAK